MRGPQSGGKDTIGEDKPTGHDDPKDWKHGGRDTLRDPKGGTYGTLPGKDDPDQVREHATPHEEAQSGADLRPDAEPMPGTLPERLQRERKGPLRPSRGRVRKE